MKYIRTKDNIYENLSLIQSNSTAEENSILVCGGHFAIRMPNIIKQSDDLKELCDCFVYGKCDYMELEEAQQEKEWCEQNLQQDGQPIYGAIWTDKGLIYVAKMNEEGELKLL